MRKSTKLLKRKLQTPESTTRAAPTENQLLGCGGHSERQSKAVRLVGRIAGPLFLLAWFACQETRRATDDDDRQIGRPIPIRPHEVTAELTSKSNQPAAQDSSKTQASAKQQARPVRPPRQASLILLLDTSTTPATAQSVSQSVWR